MLAGVLTQLVVALRRKSAVAVWFLSGSLAEGQSKVVLSISSDAELPDL